MGRSREIRLFMATCALIFFVSACGSVGGNGAEEDRQEPLLPSAEPSPEVSGSLVRDPCPEKGQLPV